jgi:cellulose synthase/poly-beta-1,6-N-acetylglucosamine synthase-like glycosyltransferase
LAGSDPWLHSDGRLRPGSLMLTALFWVSIGLLAWVYAGYPVAVALLARIRPVRPRPGGPIPTLSVAIAVHNEAAQIADRVANALGQDGQSSPVREVIVGSDGSTDETVAIVSRLAAEDERVRLLVLDRSGQTATQNALVAAATGDVIVLTDAETRFAPGCLAALTAAVRDPRVGCATGRLAWRGEQATATATQEGFYWRYERRVRELESRAGVLTAVTGALLAVRRSVVRPVPVTASMDHLLPLYVREQGGLVVYVPAAVATDRPISGLREQFRNRTRTATRGIRANLSMVGRLPPWRHPGVAVAIWSHKLLRWATPWLLVIAGSAGLFLGRDATIFLVVPAALAAGLVVAGLAHLIAGTGRRPPRAAAFFRSFAIVNLAFAAGWVNVIRGRGIEVWHRSEFRVEG